MFIQKRRFKIIFFLIASILAFGSIFFIMGLDTKAKMISAGVGGTLLAAELNGGERPS
jgi:hypothetical protein